MYPCLIVVVEYEKPFFVVLDITVHASSTYIPTPRVGICRTAIKCTVTRTKIRSLGDRRLIYDVRRPDNRIVEQWK